jgi:hypothetical protein
VTNALGMAIDSRPARLGRWMTCWPSTRPHNTGDPGDRLHLKGENSAAPQASEAKTGTGALGDRGCESTFTMTA